MMFHIFDKKTKKWLSTEYKPFRWSDRIYQPVKEEEIPVFDEESVEQYED